MKKMQNPPKGDPSKLAEIPPAPELGAHLELAGQIVGAAAKGANAWMGVSLMHTAASFGDPGTTFALMHPSAWVVLNERHPMVRNMQEAARAGWLTIEDGYAYPTQALVDVLMKNAQ